ncbi:protoporphyrinogen/coproporphyrinogen oxidase [Sungkyunkwania multivorans]|uniref:Protoporphyrinogen/coproporphyrinogen oxidase n=1 Tax=Sungkyunkwania multivorans TaxID=1173618 RepID=A0ABW3CWF1_9FLAO
MKKEDYKIHIIGAGISGLVAAIELEKAGFRPIIIEATGEVGGRVKTDQVKGYQLDHGFQVLLDAYPKAKQYLDLELLALQQLRPGALIFKNGRSQQIGDPLRDPSFLWSTLTSNVGSLADKWKIFKLNIALKKKSLESIFEEPEKTTLHYLKDFGFSDRIITNFFKPFFTGIFLEPDLQTSSRMFCFVYKMFGEGHATLPKAGIGAVAHQLSKKLSNTTFRFNTKVKAVTSNALTLDDGTELESNATIIATDPSSMISNLRNQEISWKSCDTLYFEVPKRTITTPLIGLVADKEALINNIFYHDSIETLQQGDNALLSVTVVKSHQLNETDLIRRVQDDLKDFCGIAHTVFLKHYFIPQALPDIDALRYDLSPTESLLNERIFLAGDQLLNGSLNAAMSSGEAAAKGLLHMLEGGVDPEHLVSDSL